MKLLRTSWLFTQWCGGCLRDTLLVALWILLLGVSAVLTGVVISHELPVPDWMLRKFESRLTTPGVRVRIGSATINPRGDIVLQKLSVTPLTFGTPLATIETMQLRLNRVALLARKVEPQHIKVIGLNLLLPAMFSASGQTEPVVSKVHLAFRSEGESLTLEQFSGQFANVTFTVHGAINNLQALLNKPGQTTKFAGLTDEMLRRYIDYARKLSSATLQLNALTQPHLSIELIPSDSSLDADITLTTRRMDFDPGSHTSKVGRIKVSDLHLATRLPLGALPRHLVLSGTCSAASTEKGQQLDEPVFLITLDIGADGKPFTIGQTSFSANSASINGINLKHPLALLERAGASGIEGEFFAQAAGTNWMARGEAIPESGGAQFRLEGAITSELVHLIAPKLGIDPDKLLRIKDPAPLQLDIDLGPGWRFSKARGRLDSGEVTGYTVPFDSLGGDIEMNGPSLLISGITARQGDNHATGSYWMNIEDRAFRFLLEGEIRPLGISGFFEKWWSNFWKNFDFAAAPAKADVEVAGFWGTPHLTTVFVAAHVPTPAIRGVPFEQVRTTMFIRPNFYHALNFAVKREGRDARGSFTRSVDFYREGDNLRYIEFDLTSNLELSGTAKLFGTGGAEIVEPFNFSNPPAMRLSGRVDGAASERGQHRSIDLDVQSSGGFALYRFPLSDVSFRASIRDDSIALKDIHASFAQGQAAGTALLKGTDKNRQLEFDGTLSNARLGEVISTLEQYSARERGEAPPAKSKFQQQVAQGRLNLKLAAQGQYSDPLSYYGHGYLDLTGAQLAQVNLLGALSQLLSKSSLFRFTALQLNEARSRFVLERETVTFPDLKISGNSAIIDTKGTYSLGKNQMDFSAKVYPFGHGKTALANAVGFVLVPISNALELKLIGPLEQPNWRLTYGPTSFLHNITGTKPEDAPPPQQTPADITHRLPPPYLRR